MGDCYCGEPATDYCDKCGQPVCDEHAVNVAALAPKDRYILCTHCWLDHITVIPESV